MEYNSDMESARMEGFQMGLIEDLTEMKTARKMKEMGLLHDIDGATGPMSTT